jgi:hypothetical protein
MVQVCSHSTFAGFFQPSHNPAKTNRRHLSHLFLIRARRRHLNRHVQLPRSHSVRSPRGEGGRDGMGTAPRQVGLRKLERVGNTRCAGSPRQASGWKKPAATIAALFTEDGVVVTDTGPVYGRQPIQERYEDLDCSILERRSYRNKGLLSSNYKSKSMLAYPIKAARTL